MVRPRINPLRKELEAVLAQYRRDLPARISALEALLSAGRLTELKRALHRLAGSAGTFGVPEVGDAARAAEESLVVKNSDAAQRREFAKHFARLREMGTSLASPD